MNTKIKNRPILRFQEFDDLLSVSTMKSLGHFKGGGTPDTQNDAYWKGDIPWVSSSDIKSNNIKSINISRYISELAVKNSATKIIKKHSILFVSRVGVGKLAINSIPLCTSQDFTNFYPINTDAFFIGYYFLSKDKILNKYSQGTSIRGFTKKDIESIKINLPFLPEQQKIASFLTAVDTKIEQLTKKKELLEKYKKGIMQQLFNGEVKSENGKRKFVPPTLRFRPDSTPASSTTPSHKSYPDWEEKKLGDVGSFFSGGTPTSTNKDFYSGDIPFIGSGNISDKFVSQFISEEALNNSSSKLVKKGDLLYALYGATSGEVAISKIDGAINQAVLCIRSKCNTSFLYNILNFHKGQIITNFLQGGQGNLSAKIIKETKWFIPCLEEQIKIADFLTSIDDKISKVAIQLEKTQAFKKALLQQMFC